jgi:acyl-lipid omega-6 desaturase (Delta-12 desaturase)
MTASTVRPQVTAATAPDFDPDLRLKTVVRAIPKEYFRKDMRKAWSSVALSVVMVTLSYVAIALAPWYLLPLAWAFAGTALTGFFVIGHDCGHRSFAKRKWLNDLVGHLVFLPLIYPFHGWRIMHNRHHAFTNKMDVDNAWQPWRPEAYANESTFMKGVYRYMRGRFWWLASLPHWALLHFDMSKFMPQERRAARFSALFVLVGAAVAFPTMIYTLGIWGFVKFWVIPWLGYHFWMSTFTIVHHTMPDIPFQEPDVWNPAKAQLAGTVHCDYPRWVEILCHDINVHVPHHISTAVPWYNLRKAHASLKQRWPEYIYETKFNWPLMKQITDKCHIYHPTEYYQSFKTFADR